MIERISGVLIDEGDVDFLIRMFEQLPKHGIRVVGALAEFESKLRKACAHARHSDRDTLPDVRKVDSQPDSGHVALYDLVDSAEAARILGCTAANVRDLARRGRIPRHRAGRGWVYPAASVVALAEKRAARS